MKFRITAWLVQRHSLHVFRHCCVLKNPQSNLGLNSLPNFRSRAKIQLKAGRRCSMAGLPAGSYHHGVIDLWCNGKHAKCPGQNRVSILPKIGVEFYEKDKKKNIFLKTLVFRNRAGCLLTDGSWWKSLHAELTVKEKIAAGPLHLNVSIFASHHLAINFESAASRYWISMTPPWLPLSK